MSTQSCWRPVSRESRYSILGGALLAIALATVGCTPRTTPDQQVRAVIAAGERAAEARDLPALMALVSSRYEDADGGSAVELAHFLRAYFIANQSVHLLARIDDIQFPYEDLSRVRMTIGTLGQAAAAGDGFDVAGDVQEVRLELQLERGEWKVTRAEWHSLVRT